MNPTRIQLSRRKGWRMPPNTVKVDHSTKWGNPFIVGQHGDTKTCVRLFRLLCGGYLTISVDAACIATQQRFIAHAKAHIKDLRGKDAACWCPLDQPCHADVLLEIANS